MLAIAPYAVGMDRAKALPPLPDGPKPGPLTPFDPMSPNFSKSGSYGNPLRATREKGEALSASALPSSRRRVRTAKIARSRPVMLANITHLAVKNYGHL